MYSFELLQEAINFGSIEAFKRRINANIRYFDILFG